MDRIWKTFQNADACIKSLQGKPLFKPYLEHIQSLQEIWYLNPTDEMLDQIDAAILSVNREVAVHCNKIIKQVRDCAMVAYGLNIHHSKVREAVADKEFKSKMDTSSDEEVTAYLDVKAAEINYRKQMTESMDEMQDRVEVSDSLVDLANMLS